MSLNIAEASGVWVRPSEFTDQQEELTIYGTYIRPDNFDNTNPKDRLWLGMSAYPPETFTEETMGVVWDEIEYNTINFSMMTWGITVYQSNIRKMLGNVASGTIYIYAKTWSAEYDFYKYFYQPVTVTIEDTGYLPSYTVRPHYTINDALTLNLTNVSNTIIKNISDVKIEFTAKAAAGSNLYTYEIRNGSYTRNGAWSSNINSAPVTETFNDVNSATFYVSISDTQGYSANDFVQIPNVVEYIPPTCNINSQTISATGGITTVTINGTYFNNKFGSSGSTNTITVKCRYKALTSGSSWSSWVTMSVSTSGGTYSATADISGLDYKSSYQFEGSVTDLVTTVASSPVTVNAETIFDWSESDFHFNVPVTFQNELNVLDGNIIMKDEPVLRHTGSSTNDVVLSASGGNIYLRPGGTTETAGEVRIMPGGDVILAGDLTVNGIKWSEVIAALQGIGLLD